MNTETYNVWSFIFLGGQTLGTILAVVFAFLAYRQAQKINKQQMEQTVMIHNDQKELTKLQAFIPLSAQLSEIIYINLDDPNWEDVSKSANLLELIAVAYDKELINRDILLAVYGKLFIEVYKQIYAVKDEKGLFRGRSILMENCPSTVEFYHKLLKHFQIQD